MIFTILFLSQCLLLAPESRASWLFYHKPEYRGKIIDAETKEPIEGVVVSFYYTTNTYNLGGGSTRVIHTKETLTDENGEFAIPSYTTIISPFTTSDYAECIIYKPGYASYPNLINLCGYGPETYFSKAAEGIRAECNTFIDRTPYSYTFGVLELPQLTAREERLRAIPWKRGGCDSQELPLLFKSINEENKRFGLGEEE